MHITKVFHKNKVLREHINQSPTTSNPDCGAAFVLTSGQAPDPSLADRGGPCKCKGQPQFQSHASPVLRDPVGKHALSAF